MAQRRMLSRIIIESAEFEELDPLAQLLYMRMNLIADDDGFADGYTLSRLLGANSDTFAELVDAGFIRKVDGRKFLYHIRHWRTHNTLEKKKYNPSAYYSALSDLYSGDDYIGVLPAWERPGNEPLTQYRSGQVSSVQGSSDQGNSGKDNIVLVKSSQGKSQADHDQYVKEHFPLYLKDYLIGQFGFKQISSTQLSKLLYVDGMAPEVVAWAACKAVDNSADSPTGYFAEVIRDKAERSKTLNELLELEGDDEYERRNILQITNDMNKIRNTINDEWEQLPF